WIASPGWMPEPSSPATRRRPTPGNDCPRETDPHMHPLKFPPLRYLLLAASLLPVLSAPAAARTPVDGIAGMVNGTPIFFSDVEELRYGMLQQRPGFASLS